LVLVKGGHEKQDVDPVTLEKVPTGHATHNKFEFWKNPTAHIWHLDSVGEDGVQPGKLVYWYPVLHTQLVCDVPPFMPTVCELDMQAEHAASASAAIAVE